MKRLCCILAVLFLCGFVCGDGDRQPGSATGGVSPGAPGGRTDEAGAGGGGSSGSSSSSLSGEPDWDTLMMFLIPGILIIVISCLIVSYRQCRSKKPSAVSPTEGTASVDNLPV